MSATTNSDKSAAVNAVRKMMIREASAISHVAERLGDSISQSLELMFAQQGRVIFSGVGKMGCIGRKAAATFCSTGTPALFLHAGEATHGDLGIVTENDVFIALSNSGQTRELLDLLPYLHRFGVPIVAITGNTGSELAKRSQHVIDIQTPLDGNELAPTTSTTVALAICDGLAIALAQRHGFTKDLFALFHPGGTLGRKLLLTTAELMHSGNDIPVALESTLLRDAIVEMSRKRLGAVIVLDINNKLAGIVTDGDVRRALQQNKNPLPNRLIEHMTVDPASISSDSLAADAMRLMQEREITVLPVIDGSGQVSGVLHLHDLLKAGLA